VNGYKKQQSSQLPERGRGHRHTIGSRNSSLITKLSPRLLWNSQTSPDFDSSIIGRSSASVKAERIIRVKFDSTGSAVRRSVPELVFSIR
jgi:hypothetical protein